MAAVSVIIPLAGVPLGACVRQVVEELAFHDIAGEVIVVHDGSQPDLAGEAKEAGAVLLRQSHANVDQWILAAARRARYETIALWEFGGSDRIEQLAALVRELDDRAADMIVGVRPRRREGLRRLAARFALRGCADYAAEKRMPDVNSPCRVFRTQLIRQLEPLLFNSTSLMSSLTIHAVLTGRNVFFRRLSVEQFGQDVNPVRKGGSLAAIRALLSAILFFRPIKLYAPAALFLLLATFVLALLSRLDITHAQPAFVCGCGFSLAGLLIALGLMAEQRQLSQTHLLPASAFAPLERRRRIF